MNLDPWLHLSCGDAIRRGEEDRIVYAKVYARTDGFSASASHGCNLNAWKKRTFPDAPAAQAWCDRILAGLDD